MNVIRLGTVDTFEMAVDSERGLDSNHEFHSYAKTTADVDFVGFSYLDRVRGCSHMVRSLLVSQE